MRLIPRRAIKFRSYVRRGFCGGLLGFFFFFALLNGVNIGGFETILFFLWCVYGFWGGFVLNY